MTDEATEIEIREWLADHTERGVPDGLRSYLRGLSAGGSLPVVRLQGLRSRAARSTGRPHAVLRSFAVAAVVVLILVAGLLYVAGQRAPNPTTPPPPSSASKSNAPSPTAGAASPAQPSPAPEAATPSPTASSGTPQADIDVFGAQLIDADHGWVLTLTDLLWTEDGGATWTSIRPHGTAADLIKGVHFLNATTGWVAWGPIKDGRIVVERTTDGAHNWLAPSDLPDRYPDGTGGVSIDALSARTLWVQVVKPTSTASSIGALYESQDGGKTWTDGLTDPGGWPVTFRTSTDGWTLARPLADELDVTDDGGQTWRVATITPPSGHERDSLGFGLPTFLGGGERPLDGVLPVLLYSPPKPPDPPDADGSDALAFYTTRDGGSTWTFASSIGIGVDDPGGEPVTAILDRDTWLAVPPGAAKPGIWTTLDGGQTWTDLRASGIEGFADHLWFVNRDVGWADTVQQGTGAQLYRTTDGGRTWQGLDPLAAAAPPTPNPTPGAGPYRWMLADSDGVLADYDVDQVIRRADGSYLALASQQPRIATSADARTWTLQPIDPALTDAPADHVTAANGLAEGAGGMVAVGATPLFDGSSGDARAWWSADSVQWSVADGTGMADAEMVAAVAGSDGYIAVGSDGFPGVNTQLSGAHGAAVWRSADGRTWKRVPGQSSFAGSIMTGVLRTGSGYVAWGENIANALGPLRAPVWTSNDALHWQRAKGLPSNGAFGAPVAAMTVVGDSVLAVGYVRIPDSTGNGSGAAPMAWRSTDGGRTWSAATIQGGSGPAASYPTMRDVVADGVDLIAIGAARPLDEGPSVAAVWRSSDGGTTWDPLPEDKTFANASLDLVVTMDRGFLVFGHAINPDGGTGPTLSWLAEPIH